MKILQKVYITCAVSAGILTAPLAMAHAKLTASNPAAGAVLQAAPADITLTFNEKIEQAFSTVTLTTSDGKMVKSAKAKVDSGNPTLLNLQTSGLSAGKYTVKWAVAGHDGHRRTGTYSFSVK